MKILKYITLLLLIFSISSCENELEVVNENDLPNESGQETATSIITKSDGLYKSWWITQHNVGDADNPSMMLWAASDVGSVSWGNWGMFDLSAEPRQAWNNNASYGNADANRLYFESLYTLIANANLVIKATKGELEGADGIVNLGVNKNQAAAQAYFARGLAYGYISAFYDKAFLILDTTDLSLDAITLAEQTQAVYKDVLVQSLSDFDQAINLCSNNFTVSPNFMPGSTVVDNISLKKAINSYAARCMIFNPRNKTENDGVDWVKLENYAKNGITSDLTLSTVRHATSSASDMSMSYRVFGNYWGRIDMRVIHMMDPNMPSRFPDSGLFTDLPNDGKATSIDARLLTDFAYNPSNTFRADRGYYHYSTYVNKRYPWGNYFFSDTPATDMYKSENDLMWAEAKARIGTDISGAAALVNGSSRVTRGQLPPVAINKGEILDAISYERQIELCLATFGIEFYQMRRLDLLQPGTPLHFPIPQAQLDAMAIPNYTFGGSLGVAGKDYSNGGW